jgi:hypothetical protein
MYFEWVSTHGLYEDTNTKTESSTGNNAVYSPVVFRKAYLLNTNPYSAMATPACSLLLVCNPDVLSDWLSGYLRTLFLTTKVI